MLPPPVGGGSFSLHCRFPFTRFPAITASASCRSPGSSRRPCCRPRASCDLGANRCVIECELRLPRCRTCGVRIVPVSWARPGAHHTRDFENVVAWLAQADGAHADLRLLRVGWDTVGRIAARVTDDRLDERRSRATTCTTRPAATTTPQTARAAAHVPGLRDREGDSQPRVRAQFEPSGATVHPLGRREGRDAAGARPRSVGGAAGAVVALAATRRCRTRCCEPPAMPRGRLGGVSGEASPRTVGRPGSAGGKLERRLSSSRSAPPLRPAAARGWPVLRRPPAARSAGRPNSRRPARGAAWPSRRPGS